ncbi:hypothetical protein TWF481_002763 [Arthrobotrys musiformis]|uniref:JmjC domain-containing protein n=1 Tax=Arthrobotrys musiformis TaxID=47236 RepID=A0AAV9VT41_9PEZI
MSLDSRFETLQDYLDLLKKLEKEGLVEGVPSWAALVPRNRIRILPRFGRSELSSGVVPKDHPSIIPSYLPLDGQAMQAMDDFPSSLEQDRIYRIMPPEATFADVMAALHSQEVCLPASLNRIPGIIGVSAPQLNGSLTESIISSVGFPVVGYLKDRIVNVTPTGYQADPHVDLMEVVLAVGTSTKLWVLYKTPIADVKNTVIRNSANSFNVKSMREVLSMWSKGSFYMVLQKPGDLVIVPSGWWHFVETLDGGVLSGIDTFLAQGFNIRQNIAHLQAEFEGAIPTDSGGFSNIASAQRDLEETIGYFERLVECCCRLLDQDCATSWSSLRSLTNALKSLRQLLGAVCRRLKYSTFSYTFLKSQCDKMRALLRKLFTALKSTIERAGEVVDKGGVWKGGEGKGKKEKSDEEEKKGGEKTHEEKKNGGDDGKKEGGGEVDEKKNKNQGRKIDEKKDNSDGGETDKKKDKSEAGKAYEDKDKNEGGNTDEEKKEEGEGEKTDDGVLLV